MACRRNLAALFNEMYAYVGTRVNDNNEEHMEREGAAMEEKLRAYLNRRLRSLPNEVSQTLRPLHGAEPTNRVLDHDGIRCLAGYDPCSQIQRRKLGKAGRI